MKKLQRAITRRIWVQGNVLGNQYSQTLNCGEYGTVWECKIAYSKRGGDNCIVSQKVVNVNVGLEECSKKVQENTEHYEESSLEGVDWL